ncbi:hypothetical protein NQ314_016857 [Rhamnusium bicolor]|uniref:Uncharacterized protein n=1 Tax=Rhamnusium bicolor TaxID=1586634 RepID=A0AAV8WVH5_9CUCU|nr:hypothetical protein NQ314_016857 [Rhamnusium bicolor]
MSYVLESDLEDDCSSGIEENGRDEVMEENENGELETRNDVNYENEQLERKKRNRKQMQITGNETKQKKRMEVKEYVGDSARILAVFPTPAPSHYILGNALLRGLAEAGHDVTMISPFSESNPPKGGSWRDIVLTGFVEEYKDVTLEEKLNFDAYIKQVETIASQVVVALTRLMPRQRGSSEKKRGGVLVTIAKSMIPVWSVERDKLEEHIGYILTVDNLMQITAINEERWNNVSGIIRGIMNSKEEERRN